MRMVSKIILIGFFLISFTKELLAHPETMVNYRMFFNMKNSVITDIGQSWTFDKITSELLLIRYSPSEEDFESKKDEISKNILEGLSELHYFTYISVDGNIIDKIKPSGFKAKIKDGLQLLLIVI